MRALLQRVSRASVTARTSVDDDPVETGRIGRGLVAFVGVTHDDTEAAASRLADRIATLRVFPDDEGALNRSCVDVAGAVLVVSQFTLYADTRKGRRPSFVAAARPEHAEPLVEEVVSGLAAHGLDVATGRFRTDMQVELVNDGPVTISLEV
ncbi:MAG: D-tyrosyl-tRNA(Tyr) deacylase [Actinobacteria bacterium]|nr:D-tyrosyl-tRNA(Tyr) deacylase [Actinomycetota bacterium]